MSVVRSLGRVADPGTVLCSIIELDAVRYECVGSLSLH